MIEFSGKKIYDFFLTWCMGLIFLFSSYVFMEDVLYRKFMGLNFDNSLLAVLMCISALFFGAVMSYTGVYLYDSLNKMKYKRHKISREGLGEMNHRIDLEKQWSSKSEKKAYKKNLGNLYRISMFYGTTMSCLIIFTVKLVIEIRFYNYSNIQYVLMFLALGLVFYKEMERIHEKIELVRNTCMNIMSDIN